MKLFTSSLMRKAIKPKVVKEKATSARDKGNGPTDVDSEGQ